MRHANQDFAGGWVGNRDVDKREWIGFHRSWRFQDASLHAVVMFEALVWMRANAFRKRRYLFSRETAVLAAWYPHIPWTPAPGGVEEEHTYRSRAEVA